MHLPSSRQIRSMVCMQKDITGLELIVQIQRRMTTSKYGLGRLASSLSQWAENDRPIKGQEIAGLGQSATKSLSGL